MGHANKTIKLYHLEISRCPEKWGSWKGKWFSKLQRVIEEVTEEVVSSFFHPCLNWCSRSYSSGTQSMQHFMFLTSISFLSFCLTIYSFFSLLWQVTLWLKKIYVNQPIPQYKVNARTVHILYELVECNEARDRGVSLLIEDMKQKVSLKLQFSVPSKLVFLNDPKDCLC